MTFVNMERIEKRFNNQTVLRDVSLKMDRGEIVSIIGPSGSGKSTFLLLFLPERHHGSALSRLLRPMR